MKKTIKHALSVCLILLSLTLIFASCADTTTAPSKETEAPSGETTAAPEQTGGETGEETTAPEQTGDETDAPEATTEAETDADTEPHAHAYGEWAVVKEPTCTEAGEKQRSCSCGHKETETVAATGHTEVTDAAVSATCTAAGKTEGKHCSVCNTVLVAQTEIPKTAHKYDDQYDDTCNDCGYKRDAACKHSNKTAVKGNAATCTAAGLTDGEICSDCGEILKAQEAIPAKGHTEVIDKAVAATCTSDGKTEGKHCSTCNTVLVAQTTVKAKGHTEVIDKAVAATCTSDGKTEGKHCSTCNTVLVAQTTVKAKGHTEVIDKAVEATCTTDGKTEGKHCSVCNTVLVAQTIIKAKHNYEAVVTPPTKTEDGYTTYTCKCGDSYVADEVPATGSVGLEYSVNSDGKTCTVTGMGTCTDTEVGIPETIDGYTVTSIGYSAFEDCTSLTSITIPDSVTSIGGWAFDDCTSLTSITIPDSVTSIGNGAFFGCYALTSVYITDIEKWCKISFNGSTSNPMCNGADLYLNGKLVTDLTIPDTVTSIGGSAFHGCTSLTSITIPDSVTSIGDWAFDSCTSFTSITIPDSVTSIGSSAFFGSYALTSVYITDIEKWCSISFVGDYSNPMCNGADLYLNGKLVTDLTIPDTVTSIGSWAFAGCMSLRSITIPDSVTSIGAEIFYRAHGLKTMYYNSSYANKNNPFLSTLYIEKVVFGGKTVPSVLRGNTAVASVEIKDSVTSIADYAFYGCSALTSITIPDSVTSIGNDAFYWCSSLTSVYITDIENWCKISFDLLNGTPMFYGADLYLNGKLVTDLVIPDTVTIIADGAFWGCTSLTNITIPDSVTSIGESAFSGCTSLTSITIPDSVTSIADYAFRSCTSLTSITIPDSVTSIGDYAFQGCTSLASITIPDSVMSIGDGAFYWCMSLTSITIPDGVTSIADYAFYGCDSLTSITIPDSVTSIGREAFNWCASLTSINYSGTIDQWNAIDKTYDWNYNTEDYVIHCTDGDIA